MTCLRQEATQPIARIKLSMKNRLLMLFLISIIIALAACNVATAKKESAGQSGSASSQPQSTTTTEGGRVIKQYNAPPSISIDTNAKYTAKMKTNKGTITIELFAKDAPKTVNNFVFLAKDGYYENVKFHRIIKGFMIQGGDPTGTGAGGPGYKFEDEPVTKDYSPGTIAMANAGPNTNGSQFFIMDAKTDLPKNYTIFGQVTEGIDVVHTIANTPVTAGRSGERSTPSENIVIESIEITEQK